MIAVGAVFLALALGILVGVSLGDSILVANQRDIIELMEGRLDRLREQGRLQEMELQRWEAVKPLLQGHYRERLAGKNILLCSPRTPLAEQIRALLQGGGAGAGVIMFSPRPPGESGAPGELQQADLENLLSLLSAREELAAADLDTLGFEAQGTEGGVLTWPPEYCLFLFEGEVPSAAFFEDLWLGFRDKNIEMKAIALIPWHEKCEALHLPLLEEGPNLVDNIDTFWGQAALLKMLAENASGHYGFSGAGRGLLPETAEGD